LYDEQERALKRQNIELNDRVKKFEKHIEVIKHDQPVETRSFKKISILFFSYSFRKIIVKN
jgi:hypothetical protein